MTIPTRQGVTESYLVMRNPPSANPKAVMLAFVGIPGVVGLTGKQVPLGFGPGANTLLRMRNELVDADVVEVAVDAPSDKLPQGMSDEFRLGPDHATDIRAVIVDVKKRFPDARVFLVGHSRGTVSAAALGAQLGDAVQGVVLISSATNRDKQGPALSAFDFASIKVPVLLVHHRNDGCYTNPYSNVAALAKSFTLITVDGGDPPQSGPCDPQSAHGLYGRDAAVAQAIKGWMLGRDFPREIP